jgi:GntR family transcriptional repressor for pyruvate dehydrogenase complex
MSTLKTITLPKDQPASDQVIARIKSMIASGELKPGDRLPAERKLALDLGFGRTQIREALHKLEFYGIVKTLPQSGTVVNRLDITALDGLISDVVNLQEYDFYSLVETRVLLEAKAIRLCAERRTEEDLTRIKLALQQFINSWDTPERVTFDFAFHRAIAEASHNQVIKAMLLIITPDILAIYNRERFCAPRIDLVVEHQQMVEAIRIRDAEGAEKLMIQHLQDVTEFARQKLKGVSDSGCK